MMAKKPYDKTEIMARFKEFGAVSWQGVVYTAANTLENALDRANPALFEPLPVEIAGMENFLASLGGRDGQVSELEAQLRDTQAAHIADLQKALDTANAERAALAVKVAEYSAPNNSAANKTRPAAATPDITPTAIAAASAASAAKPPVAPAA